MSSEHPANPPLLMESAAAAVQGSENIPLTMRIDKLLQLIAPTFTALSIGAIAIFYFCTRTYLAVATVELWPKYTESLRRSPPKPEFRPMAPTTQPFMEPPSDIPAHIKEQLEILQSQEILLPVVQKLDLAKKLTLKELRSELELSKEGSTGLIAIGVRDRNPQLAANLANAIAYAYRDDRLKLARRAYEEGLERSKKDFEADRKRVEEEHQAGLRTMGKLKIVDNDPLNPAAPITSQRLDFVTAADVNELKNKIDQINARLEVVTRLKPDELMESSTASIIDSDTVRKVLPLLRNVEAEEKRLLQLGLAEKDPCIKEQRIAEQRYKATLQAEIEALRRSEAEQLKVAEETLQTLEEQLPESVRSLAEWRKEAQAYIDAKTKYLEDRRHFDSMNELYQAEVSRGKGDLAEVNVREAPPAKR